MERTQGCHGIPNLRFLACRYYASTSNSFGTASESVISFDTLYPGTIDSGNFARNLGSGGTFSTPNTQFKLVIPETGIYSLVYSAEFTTWPAANQIELRVYINGTFVDRLISSPGTNNVQGARIINPGFLGNAGDTLQFTVIQSTGSTILIRNNAQETFVQIAKIG